MPTVYRTLCLGGTDEKEGFIQEQSGLALSAIRRIIRSQVEVPAESSIGYCRWHLHLRQPKARQITADLLRATGDALASAVENRTLEDPINAVLVGE